jgi:hypothetical protein
MKIKYKQRSKELTEMLSKYRDLLMLPTSSKIFVTTIPNAPNWVQKITTSVNAISQEAPHTSHTDSNILTLV